MICLEVFNSDFEMLDVVKCILQSFIFRYVEQRIRDEDSRF